MSEAIIYAASWLLNPAEKPVSGGAIAVRDGVVIAVGTKVELQSSILSTVVDYSDAVILPGFINAHTHLELTHFPSWREQHGMEYSPRSFVDWIIQLIKINRGVSSEHFRLSLQEGIRKSLQSGTTAVGDILTHYDLLPLYQKHPVGGRLYFETLGYDPNRFIPRLNEALAAAISMKKMNIKPALSPHSPYTISEQFIRKALENANLHKLPLAIHISESIEESEFMHSSTGLIAETMYPFIGWEEYLTPQRRCSSTEYLNRLGLLSEHTVAVHCVHTTPSDARILKENGVSICLCPRSNQHLDVGKAPAALFKKLQIPLAIGTDSLASNDSLSLWDEIRFAHDEYGGVLNPLDLLVMATTGGAKALCISDRCGSLNVGKRADFQVVKLKCSRVDNLAEQLLAEAKVEEVYLGGERFTHKA